MKKETTGGILFLVIGLITVILSSRMHLGDFRMAGTGLFPFCLGMVLIGLSLPIVFRGLFGERKEGEAEIDAQHKGHKKNVFAFLLFTSVSVLLFNSVGFAIFSFLILFSLMWLLGFRDWVRNGILSLLVATGAYMVFVKLLKIPLPKGIIGL